MTDRLRQVSVILTVVATIVINALANALPINGLNTGQISDRFQVYFVPAGYAFSIWGVIYLGLIAFAIFQALPSQRANPRLRAAGWWICLGGLANISWIFLWHYEQFVLTLIAMFVLLVSLIATYLSLRSNGGPVGAAETWLARVPFSIYIGWITVATVANVTIVLDYAKWDRFGIAPEIWMWIVLAVVLVIVALMSFTRRDVAYVLVILWALYAITVKQAAVPTVVVAVWVTFGLVLLSLIAAFWLSPAKRNALQRS